MIISNNNFRNILTKIVLLYAFMLFGSSVTAAQATNNQAKKPQAETLVYEAEKLLSDLGYWITKVDGVKDSSTRHATAAFQKVERRKRTGVLTQKELEAMREAVRPTSKFKGASHIEIDITRQILFLVDESGNVARILPVSSGSDKKYFSEKKWQTAHTPRGSFTITGQINGVRHAPLGDLYYPNYFFGGVAIHGSNSIPLFPASHGCIRIPNFAAQEFQTLVSVGMPVFVYD